VSLVRNIPDKADGAVSGVLSNETTKASSDLEALERLNAASSQLWHCADLAEGLKAILASTIQTMGASLGNVQLLDPRRNVLRIAAQNGFKKEFLDYFAEVSTADESACGRALRAKERIIIFDVETEPSYEPMREAAREAGYRAVQSTPLIGRHGTPLGMLSTHYATPYAPNQRELRLLDLYARQASDFIERCHIDDAIRASAERERTRTRELEAAEKHREFLVAELKHRVKNTLATVMALWQHSCTKAESLEAAKKSFAARLLALSNTHTSLGEGNWNGASLTSLLEGELRPYVGRDRANVEISGPDLHLNARAAVMMGLAFHELCTNSAKYGAFSSTQGKISTTWTMADGKMRFEWKESGGPPVSPPARRGFGRFLIERGIASDFGGDVDLNFDPGGLICRVTLPLEKLLAAEQRLS